MDAVSASELSFADIISPVDPTEFHERFRGAAPLHIEGTPDKYAGAMSWDLLTDILNQTAIWTPSKLKLVLDTRVLTAQEYCTVGHLPDGNQGLVIDMAKVREWLARGASIVLNDVETFTPGMKAISAALGVEPGGKVQGNLYCSWKEHQAFPVHYDTHDVFALQVAGEKRWRIYGRHFKDPINHPTFKQIDQSFHEQHKGPLSMEFVMKPGDMVYVPSGFYHEALAESDGTIHVSFSVVPMIGLDVISAIFERAVMDDVFRQAIPHLSVRDGKATEEHLMRLAGRFRELLRDPQMMDQLKKTLSSFRFPRSTIKLPDDIFKE